jgi:hypothetical protein
VWMCFHNQQSSHLNAVVDCSLGHTQRQGCRLGHLTRQLKGPSVHREASGAHITSNAAQLLQA